MKTTISALSPESLGTELVAVTVGSLGSVSWPTTNKAIFIPFELKETVIVNQLWMFQGGAATDAYDIGIYTLAGAKLASLGSTVAGNNSVINPTALVNSLTLTPGKYYLAMSAAGTTLQMQRVLTGSIEVQRAMGIMQMLSAFPLPATATLVKVATTDYVPIFGLAIQTVM